jgi:GTP-binding protein
MYDKVTIRVKAGDGGDGAVSFRREKFVPYGGPDGGDGGNGGDVIIRADGSVDSLIRYRRRKIYRAPDGADASGRKKHGKNGAELVLTVPPGTFIEYSNGTDTADVDLARAGDEAIVARGGQGGWGNTHFATSVNQVPHIAQRGEAGEESTVTLEMRLIADVGIIGYPNAGKSTLLTAASAARPKIADYPFTTIEPALGVVEIGNDRFIMAEVPGLIEGAHQGKGLGHEFLQHIHRTKILIHLVSGESESPLNDMIRVNQELSLYDPDLSRKPQIVALNKTDLPEVNDLLPAVRDEFKNAGIRAHYISAATGEGVPELMAEAMKILNSENEKVSEREPGRRIFHPQPRDTAVSVEKKGGVYHLHVPDLERLIAGPGASPAELRWQMQRQLTRRGLIKQLEKAGIAPGDRVRCGELEWEW